MPAAVVHKIFGEDVKKKLNKSVIVDLPDYDKYLIAWQGHDLLIYPNFKEPFRIIRNNRIASMIMKSGFAEFVYTYLRIAKNQGMLSSEQVRLILYGYIGHHMLDAYAHPLIVYMADGAGVDKSTWQHGNIEAYLDAYFLKMKKGLDLYRYNPDKDFIFNEKVDPKVITLMNTVFRDVYSLRDIGRRYIAGLSQFHVFMHWFRYDPSGNKKRLFTFMENHFKFAVGTKSFSNHVEPNKAMPYMNIDHSRWVNIKDFNISSNESFIELYNRALVKTSGIINTLEAIIKSGDDINRETIFSIIPDVSSSTGLMSS